MPEEQSGDKRIIQDPQTGKKYSVPASASDEDIRLYLEQKRIRGGAGMGRAAEPAPAVVTPSPKMPDFSQQAQGQHKNFWQATADGNRNLLADMAALKSPELQQQLPNAMPAQQEQPAPSGLVERRQVRVPTNTSVPVGNSGDDPIYALAAKDRAIYDLVQTHRFEYWRGERMRAERMAKQASVPPSDRSWLQETMYTATFGEPVQPYDPELAKGLKAQASAYSDDNWIKRFGSGSPEQLAEMYSDIERANRTRGQELPPAWGAAIAKFTEGFAGFGKGVAEFFSPPPENVDTSGPIIPWAEERLSRPDTGTGAKIAGMVSHGIGQTTPSLVAGAAVGALAGGLFAAKATAAAAAGNLAKAASLAKSARIWKNVVTLGTQVGVNAMAAEKGQRLETAGWGTVAMMAALPAYSWLTKLPIKYDLVKYPLAGFGSNIAGEAPHIVIDLISGKPLGPDALEQLTAAGLTGAVFGFNDIGPAKQQRAYDAVAKLAEQEMLSRRNKAAQEEQNARARQLLGERKSEQARVTSAEEFANRIEERERFRRAQELKQERQATGETAEQAAWKEAVDYRIQQEEAARSAQADETRQQLLDEDTQDVLADMAENAGADRNKFLREMSGELTSRAQVTGKPGTQPLSAGEAARRRIAKRAKDRGVTLGSGIDLFDAARELVDYGIIAGEKLVDAVDTLIVHGGRVGARVGEQIRGYLARNNGDTRGIPNILESLTDYEKSELTDALESSRLDVEESMASESVPAAPGGAEVVPSEGGLGRANVITGKREGLPAPGELPPPLPPTESGWFRPESAADRARARINERMKNIGGVRSSMGVLEAIEGARNLIDGTIIASDKIASVISALRKYGGSWGQKLSTRISEALSRGATAEEIPSIVSSGFHPTVLQDLSVKMLEARAEAERMSVDQPSVSIRQGRGQPARVGESARAKDYMALTVQQEPYRAVIESSFNDAITVYEEMGLKTHQVKELARLEATVAEYEAYLADVESGKVVPNTAIEQTRLKRIQRELPTLREKIDRKVGVYKAAAIKPSSSLAEPIEAETGSSQQEPSQQTGLRWDKERSKVRRPSEYNSGVTEDTLFADLDLNVRPDDYLYDTEAIQWLEDGKWYVGRVIGDGLADGMIEVSYRGRDRVINIISKERSGYVDKIERLGHWDKNPSPEIEDTSIPKQGLRLLEKKEAPKAAAPIQVDDSASKIADVLDERRRVGEEALAKWRSRRASSSTEEFRASPSRVFEKMMVAPEAITAEETSYVAQMLRDAGVNDKIVSQFESGQLARLLKIMDKKQKASVRDLFNKAEAQHLMGSTPEQAPSVSGRQQAGAEFGGETGGETYSTRGGGLGRESVDIASKTPGSVEYAKAAGQIAGEQARFSAESSGVYSPEQIDAISKYESARAALNGLSKTPPKDAAAWTQVKAKAQNDIVTYKSKLPADYKPIQIGGEGEGGLGRSPSTGGTTLYGGLIPPIPPEAVRAAKNAAITIGRGLASIPETFMKLTRRAAKSAKGSPAALEFVNRGDIAADETRRLVSGEFRPELTEVLNSTGSLELPTAQRLVGTERVRAADELSATTRAPGKNYSPMPAWVNAVESGAKGLPAPQQRIVDSMIALLQKTWDTARNAGALRYNAAKDIYEPLPAHTGPGSVVPRMPTADWLQILQSTADIPDPIVDAFADLNPGMSRTDVLDALNEARAAMGAPNIGGKRAKQSAFEFFRNFGDVPASVTVNGVDIPLFETNIAKYAKTRAQNAAARLGVMKAGLDDISYDPTTMKPSPNPSQREILREDFKLSGGNPDTFDEALSAIEGREIEQASESPGAKVARTFLSFINGPVKAAKLSASPLYNPVEPLGGAREQASTASMAQAYAEGIASGVHRMMGGASPFDQQRAAMESLESRGAVPIEKSGTQRFVSGVSARAMELAAKRMQDRAGNPDASGVASDTIRLRQMGYDIDTARRLASGSGTADEYQMLIRKAAAQTTGAGLGGGELTRFDYSRVFRAAFPIRRYGIQQLQQITRTARLAVDALRPNMTGAERAAAGKQILTTAAFRATQGIAQNIMWSALMGGSAGLEAAWSDLKDDPVGAALRGLAASVFSGNMAGVAQQMMKEDGNFFKAIYPVAIAMEAKDFFTNGGRYKDLEWSDHIWEGMQWLVPALRAANGSAHLVGSALGMDTAAFDIKQSRAAYRSWARRNNIPDIRVQTINAPENVERYTDAMKKFRMAVEDQDSDDKLVEILREAFDVKGNESIASTINNYRILREPSKEAVRKGIVTSGLTKEQKDSLRSNIGEQNYKRLEAEDKLLEELANAFESGKRFKESRIRRALDKGGMGRAR